MEEDPNFHDFKDNVIVEQSPEGLKITLIDDDKVPMFEPKGTQLTQAGEKILSKMAEVIKAMPNRISITGHTEATNYVESSIYTNWELTADRANAARRFLMTTNMEPGRVAKVTGRADQELLDPKQPTSARNRRVEIILLRESYLKTLDEQTAAPTTLLTVPKASDVLSGSAKPAPKPVAKPVVKQQEKPTKAPVEEIPDTKAEKTNISPEQGEFKMPDTIKRSMDSAPAQTKGTDGDSSAGSKTSDSLNSLPSGFIKTDGNQ